MADDGKRDDKRDDKLLVLPLGEESKLITQTIANDTARQILELLAEGAMSTSAIAKKLDIPLTTAQYNVEKLIEAGLVVVEKTKYSEKGREVKLYAPAKRMIVLVPANTPRHAVMDVLKRYLVLIPVAGFIALMVELAMQFGNGTLSAVKKSTESQDTGGLLATSGGNASDFANAPPNGGSNWASATPSPLPTHVPAPTALPAAAPLEKNGTFFGDGIRSNGSISGQVSAGNTTAGVDGAYMPGPPGNATGGYDVILNHSPEAMKAGGDAVTGTSSGAGPALIPADLLNHWGLWFFLGCLLIIGILVAYELYRTKKK